MTDISATISDMFEAHERGLAMGVFAAMPFLGPVIGPIVRLIVCHTDARLEDSWDLQRPGSGSPLWLPSSVAL